MELTLCTFNIRHDTPDDGENRWEKRCGAVFEIWRERQWDLAGLQEALRHQIEQICHALPDYRALGVGRDDGREAGEHCPILYRTDRFDMADSGTFWLSDTPEVVASTTWGNRTTRICTWARLVEKGSERAFFVYNVHTDHESQPSRERSSRLLIERIRARRPDDPAILLGDLNAGEDNPAVTALQAPDSPVPVETYRARYGPVPGSVGTFHGYTGKAGRDKIDYIFTSPEWEVRDADIIRTSRAGRYPSDHFPVCARLRLPSAPGPNPHSNGEKSISRRGPAPRLP